METAIRQTWFSSRPSSWALMVTLGVLWLMVMGSYASIHGVWGADQWMPASFDTVFGQHQYWRLFTALFAHGDLAHLASNALIFFPFAYFLSGYFSLTFFPLAAILIGGVINAIVIAEMPPERFLVGFSGVVHWMGAAYLMLYLLIERSETFRRRLAKFLIISVVLFVPEIYRPEVSYFAHFVGYVLGLISGYLYFRLHRDQFRRAEVTEVTDFDERLLEPSDDTPELPRGS